MSKDCVASSRRKQETAPIVNFARMSLMKSDTFARYATADSFVLPTHGEGWGIYNLKYKKLLMNIMCT